MAILCGMTVHVVQIQHSILASSGLAYCQENITHFLTRILWQIEWLVPMNSMTPYKLSCRLPPDWPKTILIWGLSHRPHDTIHPLNITYIHNMDLIPATALNIFWLLLIYMNSFYPLQYLPTPTILYSFLLPPLISTNSDNPHPISNIRQPPFTMVNSCSHWPQLFLLIPKMEGGCMVSWGLLFVDGKCIQSMKRVVEWLEFSLADE